MSEATVRDIHLQIDSLSDSDKLDFSIRLAEQQDNDWSAEAEVARRVARERGIDQGVINRVICDIRRKS
jgi:hypothetical protein